MTTLTRTTSIARTISLSILTAAAIPVVLAGVTVLLTLAVIGRVMVWVER